MSAISFLNIATVYLNQGFEFSHWEQDEKTFQLIILIRLSIFFCSGWLCAVTDAHISADNINSIFMCLLRCFCQTLKHFMSNDITQRSHYTLVKLIFMS